MPLYEVLAKYRDLHRERWHTPGHKGRAPERGDFLDWAFDLTEIPGLEPKSGQDPVRASERLMAEQLGVRRTWYSVQGASLPVTVGMLAAFAPGAEVLVDRNAHRSVLSGLMLGGFKPKWIYPRVIAAGVTLPLGSGEITGAVGPKTGGLVLTRPSYDGLAGDVGEALGTLTRQKIPVLVDEAHGSHWSLSPQYPVSAIALGADLVAHGTHKTERALTQTGLLHYQGTRVAERDVQTWWSLLSTTSPSYLLLASLDRLQWERREPGHQQRWSDFAGRMRALWGRLSDAGVLTLGAWWEKQGQRADPAKLTILGDGSAMAEALEPWGVVEKVVPGACTLIVSPWQNTVELEQHLREHIPRVEESSMTAMAPFPILHAALSPRDVWGRASVLVPLHEAKGRVARDAVTPYPPGVPLVMPGEIFTREVIDVMVRFSHMSRGVVSGLEQKGDMCVWVIAD